MLLKEIAGQTGRISLADWKFEVISNGSKGGTKGETINIDWFTDETSPYFLTSLQLKQYFTGMQVGDVRIIMSKTAKIKIARSK